MSLEVIDAAFNNETGLNIVSRRIPGIIKELLSEHYSGDILKHIASLSSESERLDLCRTLFRIISELHERGILHGSICAGNISWKAGSIVLNNARLFMNIQHRLTYIPVLPCAPYRSRDELEKDEYIPTVNGDMYALTIFIYTVFCGEEPFAKYSLQWRVSKVAQCGHLDLKKPQSMPSFLWKILLECWRANPEDHWLAFGQLRRALQ